MRTDTLERTRHNKHIALCGVTDKRTRLLTDEVGVRIPPEGQAEAEA